MTTDKAPWYDRGSLTLSGLFYITLTVTWRDGGGRGLTLFMDEHPEGPRAG